MPRFTFRFGELNKAGTEKELDVNLDRVENKIEEEGIVGEKGNRRWARQAIRGSNSIYFEFIKEIPQKFDALSEDEEIIREEVARIRPMHFLLFDNGIYGFESRRSIHDKDALEYLFEDFKQDYEYSRFENLGLDTMRSFYKSSNQVRKIKAENIGEKEPNPHVTDEELREITEDTGLRTNSIIASVGRAKENLKEVSLFDDGIAKYSDLPLIKSMDAEENIRKLRDSGRFDFGVSAPDDEAEKQASQIRDTVRGAMGSLFNVSVDDGDDSEDLDGQDEDSDQNE